MTIAGINFFSAGRVAADHAGMTQAEKWSFDQEIGSATGAQGRSAQSLLRWVLLLRWMAAAGQLSAVAVAVLLLNMQLNLLAVLSVIGVTLVTNTLLWAACGRMAHAEKILPAVLLTDVLLLTALLAYTGGAENPFSSLYIVHVAMAVAVAGVSWGWITALFGAVGYAFLFLFGPSDQIQALSPQTLQFGQWLALALLAVLMVYFLGRVLGELALREAELRAERERAARNEQLATLTTLAAGAAHELGSPLGTIAVAAKELERSAGALVSTSSDAASSMADDARLIRQEVDRCRKIINRMRIDVGSEESRRHSPITAADLVALLKEDLRADELPRLVTRLANPQATFHLPVRNVHQALVVMLRNAFDASPQDSKVIFEITPTQRGTLLSVIDQGPGISEEVLRRAGQPFFTTKEVGKGMGLGLFLTRLIAETYHGSFNLSRLAENQADYPGTRADLFIPSPKDIQESRKT